MKARLAWIVAALVASVAGGAVFRSRHPGVLAGAVRRMRRTAGDDWDDLFI